MKLELGALQFTVEVKDGEPQQGTPRVDIVSDHVAEVMPHMPDGVYKWTLVLDVEKAEKAPLDNASCVKCHKATPCAKERMTPQGYYCERCWDRLPVMDRE